MRFSLSVSVEKNCIGTHWRQSSALFERRIILPACVKPPSHVSEPFPSHFASCFPLSPPIQKRQTLHPTACSLSSLFVRCSSVFLVVFSFFVVVLWTVFVCRTVRCRKSFFGVDLSINRKSLFEWSEKAFGPQCNQERTAYWLCLSLFLALV